MFNFRFKYSLCKYIAFFDYLVLYTLSEAEVHNIQKDNSKWKHNDRNLNNNNNNNNNCNTVD